MAKMKKLNLVGKKRGRLTFIEFSHIKNYATYWKCKCSCGNTTTVQGSGNVKSCGCLALIARSKNGKKNKNLQSPIEFIKSRIIIDKKTKCWNWTKSLIKGYARMTNTRNKESALVSRYVYKCIKGKDPSGMLVCHTCDNPKCVNPDHLFLGTHIDNFRDMRNKGRSAKGIKNNKAKLTNKDVLEIRKLIPKLKMVELARIYGVTRTTIGDIKYRRSWKHI